MRCGYCYHSDQANLPFKTGVMEYEIAQEILTQAAALGVESVKTNWKGESTINKDFEKITLLAKSLGFIDRLSNSNFKFRTDREDIFRGFCHQTKVKISYDSFRKEVFEGQRCGGDHDVTTRNIDKFYSYPGRDNELVIQAVRTQKNKDEDLAYECNKRWPGAKISIRDMVAGRVDKDLSDLENKTRDASERQSCLQAHVRLIFNHAGVAFPCCPDVGETLALGDIRKNSLYEIFTGAKAKMLRKNLKNKSAFSMFDACKNCSSFESYKGYKAPWVS